MHTEKSPRNAPGQFHFVRRLLFFVLINRGGEEIDLGLSCPNAVGVDQTARELIVRTVLSQLFAKPIDHAMAAVNQEGSVLDADVSAGETLGDIVTIAPILEEPRQPPLSCLVASPGFQQPDFFE